VEGLKGPVLVYWAVGTEQLDRAALALLNPESMKLINPELNTQNMSIMMSNYRNLVHLRASADGRVFGLWCTSHGPSGIGTIQYTKAITQSQYVHNGCGYVVPGPDGKTLYTRLCRYPLGDQGQLPQRLDNGDPMLPACRGTWHLSLPPAGRGAPTVEAPGKEKPIATLSDLGLPTPREDDIRHDFTFDKRVHLIPEARLLVTIPASNDRLVLHRLDR
jgi:hypothetical protein